MYTFDVDKIMSYELGSDEPSTLAVQNINLFTASADAILSRMGKVYWLRIMAYFSWSCCVFRCLRGLGSWRR
jgi:hypothetical protein